MVRGQARKAPLRHHGVAAFEMAGKPLGIEQRKQKTVPVQTFAEGLEAVGVMGQRHGKRSHFLHGAGDAFVKADGVEQARGDAGGEVRPPGCDDGNSGPERVGGHGMPVVHAGIQSEIREP